MCRLRNIAMPDYQESVTTGQSTEGQRSDPCHKSALSRLYFCCRLIFGDFAGE